MKLIGRDKGLFVFHLGPREKALLSRLFQIYPLLPDKYQPLSKKKPAAAEAQDLLAEALREHRSEQKQQMDRLLNDPEKWEQDAGGSKLRLSSAEVEMFLQMLNDVRVGSWVKLGSPEEPMAVVNEENTPLLWAMEIAGSFQAAFLHVLDSPQTPPPT